MEVLITGTNISQLIGTMSETKKKKKKEEEAILSDSLEHFAIYFSSFCTGDIINSDGGQHSVSMVAMDAVEVQTSSNLI